jgi:electron transfer flavoprotein beta subunit
MKIVVLVKSVPDTYGDRRIDLETGLADRGASESVLDEIGERAVELALTLAAQERGTTVDVLSMAPEEAQSVIRKGLAMGADSAVQVVDPALLGADLTLTAEVLAAAVRRGGYDLVVAGNLSTDGAGGVIPAMLAELLDLPQLTQLSTLELSGGRIRGTRTTDIGVSTLSAELPAVVSITEAFPDARFPNFKGIMAAKKKPLETLALADLGIDPEDYSVPRAIMTAAAERPPREAGVKIEDDGTAAAQLADFLVQNRLA